MKRWNGWGTENIPYPLPPSAERYLKASVGPGCPQEDATLEQCLKTVPPSRLQDSPLFTTDPEIRLRHSRGHSMPDWIALRSCRIGAFPDAVAFPQSDDDLKVLFGYSRKINLRIIPYGGGTSVVGHINPLPGDHPILTVDLAKMCHLENLDDISLAATFGAGVRGPDLEAALNQKGYTLGHFPQSFEYSTLGGWVASRGVGTQCYYYGRIEDLFIGGHIETPEGALELPNVPASAAGPDLKHLVLGSEGRLGIISRATVRVSPLPERNDFYAVFFPTWQEGVSAVREIVQNRVKVSMLRLSNATETETTLQLSGKEKFVTLAHNGLTLIGIGSERCLLVFGVTGEQASTHLAYQQTVAITRRHHGFSVDFVIGHMWYKSRFTTPYLRNTLWEKGYAIDTLETALPWSKIETGIETIQQSLRDSLATLGERTLVFAHLSHHYRDGASMYITYLFRQAADPEETLHRWQLMKTAASQTIVHLGGTISHQHGVGIDHAPYLSAEKGVLGMKALNTALTTFDPDGIMNPGKLITY